MAFLSVPTTVKNGRPTLQPRPGGQLEYLDDYWTETRADPSGTAWGTRVNGMYKAGATNGWERPGSNLT